MDKKYALITGATSGIDAAFAKKYAGFGYNLIITGRRVEKINQLAEEIRNRYCVEVEVIIAELSDENNVKALAEKIKDKEIHVLVNNAGFGYNALFQNGDIEICKNMVNVHVLTPMYLMHELLPGMIMRGCGTIINVSSEGAYIVAPKNAVYTGTKSFLKSFTEALYFDLIGTGVKVQALCPGLTKTDFHEKMGMSKKKQVNKGVIKWMSPDELVDISVNALSKDKVVCIPGMHEKLLIKFLNMMSHSMYKKFICNLFSKKNKDKRQTA